MIGKVLDAAQIAIMAIYFLVVFGVFIYFVAELFMDYSGDKPRTDPAYEAKLKVKRDDRARFNRHLGWGTIGGFLFPALACFVLPRAEVFRYCLLLTNVGMAVGLALSACYWRWLPGTVTLMAYRLRGKFK